jgi:hypothetical protein
MNLQTAGAEIPALYFSAGKSRLTLNGGVRMNIIDLKTTQMPSCGYLSFFHALLVWLDKVRAESVGREVTAMDPADENCVFGWVQNHHTRILDYLGEVILDDAAAAKHFDWLGDNFASQVQMGKRVINKKALKRLAKYGLPVDDWDTIGLLLLAPDCLVLLTELVRDPNNQVWARVTKRLVQRRISEKKLDLPTFEQFLSKVDQETDTQQHCRPRFPHSGTTHSEVSYVATRRKPMPHIERSQLNDREINTHFRRRVEHETVAAFKAAELPQPERGTLTGVLHAVQKQLKAATTRRSFVDRDREFHDAICRAVHQTEYAPGDLGHRHRLGYADHRAPKRSYRSKVLREHDSIIVAIDHGLPDAASRAMRFHLLASRNRWIPNFMMDAIQRDIELFDGLAVNNAPDIGIVASINVCPVEMMGLPQLRRTIGQAAARALARGLTIVYLRPGPKLLEEYQRLGIPVLMTCDEIAAEFDEYQNWVIDYLCNEGYHGRRSEVTGMVKTRMGLIMCDHEQLFDFVRANHCVGYFQYMHGCHDVINFRQPASDFNAALDIETPEDSEPCKAQFRVRACQALQAAEDCPDPEVSEKAEHIRRTLGIPRRIQKQVMV